MSVENVKKFGQLVAENEEVRKKVKEIGTTNIEGLIAYGKELGFDFSMDDMTALAKEAGLSQDELSEEQLEKVAGGVLTLTAAAAVGAVAGVVGAVAGVGAAAAGVGALGVMVGSEASRNW